MIAYNCIFYIIKNSLGTTVLPTKDYFLYSEIITKVTESWPTRLAKMENSRIPPILTMLVANCQIRQTVNFFRFSLIY